MSKEVELRRQIYEISLTPIRDINDGIVNPPGSIGLSNAKIDQIIALFQHIQPTEQTPHDMFCTCPTCIKLKGGVSDVFKGQAPVQGDEDQLKNITAELADDVAEIRYLKTWKNLNGTEQAAIMAATVELAMHVQKMLHQDRKAFAQRVLAAAPMRPDANKRSTDPLECKLYGYMLAIDEYSEVVRKEAGLHGTE